MITRFRLAYYFLALFVLSSITAAWPWPRSFKDLSLDVILLRRQDNSDDKAAASSSAKETAAETAKETAKGTAKKAAKSTAEETAKGSAKETAKGTAKASGTAAETTGKAAKTGAKASDTAAATSGEAAASETSAAVTSVSDVLPPGGVNMLEPSSVAAQSSYYKISGDPITFKWNYTSLSIKPSKINVFVSCAANSATYTLASNDSFRATDSVVWDTKPDATGTAPLLTETYTLVIYDAAEAITAVPGAGRLGTNDQMRFGMYLPQKYTPRTEWTCAVCSAALSDTERQAIKFMLAMCGVTVLSFTWFVSGFSGFFGL